MESALATAVPGQVVSRPNVGGLPAYNDERLAFSVALRQHRLKRL
jgi:hypothetical protein